jgi:hypothetical protein
MNPEKISNEEENDKNKTSSNKDKNSDNKSTFQANIDLSDIEANEQSLKNYTLSKQFLKLDLDKIRELIEIMEDYCQSLVEKEDINLAKKAKQRLILLKKAEKEKMMREAKIIYSNQLELVEDKMNEDLDIYISNSDAEYDNLIKKLEEQENEMEKINKEEIEEYKTNFEQSYNQLKPKPSKDSLNWMKIRECAMRQNIFNKAQEADKEIEILQKKDSIKFNEDKEKKLNIELNKIKHRQNLEKNVFEMKKNSIITEFTENKKKEIEKIKKKYESKISELKNYQNFEISNFDKITKGVIKPCARIQSIVSSATGFREDEEEKKSEEKDKENAGKEENKENKDDNNNNKEEEKDANEQKGENEDENEDDELEENEIEEEDDNENKNSEKDK